MAWRKTRTFHAPVEVLVLTCDVCACDIGHEDERRPRAHFQLSVIRILVRSMIRNLQR